MENNIDTEKISDGFHTFDELYDHRAVLFSIICNQNFNIAWKSRLHSDGTMYDNMFIAGIDTYYGKITYHIENKYWSLFKIRELEIAPEFDGYSSDDVLDRLIEFSGISKRFNENSNLLSNFEDIKNYILGEDYYISDAVDAELAHNIISSDIINKYDHIKKEYNFNKNMSDILFVIMVILLIIMTYFNLTQF